MYVVDLYALWLTNTTCLVFYMMASCRNSSRFTSEDLLSVLRHKSNSPTHPKIITEQSEWKEQAREEMVNSILCFDANVTI